MHCNIYALNREEPECFHQINGVVVDMEGQKKAGDINQVLDGMIDKSKLVVSLFLMQSYNSPELNRWGMVKPREREYTLCSHCHDTFQD